MEVTINSSSIIVGKLLMLSSMNVRNFEGIQLFFFSFLFFFFLGAIVSPARSGIPTVKSGINPKSSMGLQWSSLCPLLPIIF